MIRYRPVFGIAEANGSAALVAAASASLSDGEDDFGVVAHSDVSMCVVDATAPDMPIVFANAAFLALSGYAADEVVGRNCRFMQGPQTVPEDMAQFGEGLASERPFQVSLVNHRKDGQAFRNEVFVSPVRNRDGAIVRFVGIQIPLTTPGSVDLPEVAALRHQFRNQIQTMTSLVSLLGQRLPAGEGRDAFEDLRARFEALTIAQTDELSGDGPVPADRALIRLVDRAVQLYDPLRRHAIEIAIDPIRASTRRTTILAQIFTEMLIDLFRNGLCGERSRARIAAEATADRGIRLRIDTDAVVAAGRSASNDLGLAILANLTRSLGGTFERSTSGGLAAEVTLLAEPGRS